MHTHTSLTSVKLARAYTQNNSNLHSCVHDLSASPTVVNVVSWPQETNSLQMDVQTRPEIHTMPLFALVHINL